MMLEMKVASSVYLSIHSCLQLFLRGCSSHFNSTNFETIIKVKPVDEDTKSVVLDAHSIPADVKPEILDYERFDHIIGG
ncbi:hypothetical protein L596_000869 [Steinernema carpocapsae]|uniref:Uncharacterized protein n=1 Tax=Steinernema carpocapsae TaxID=34508 RepID=A0A4V6I784_STECR|nr:hypothetical protein L596_000869 [Steinernema carpocapsae]